jgi:hypothetical protein
MGKVLLAVLLCFALASCNNPSAPAPTVVGKWAEQSGAAWEFSADGKVTIKDNHDATYKVSSDKAMTIDYHDTQNFGIDFTYELSATKLILHPQKAHGDGALPTDWEEDTVLVRSS